MLELANEGLALVDRFTDDINSFCSFLEKK
jgi:hypothetical protein